MREPFTQLFVHLVWSTWDRAPLITPELQGGVYGCIQAECRDLRCEVIAIGGIEDHVRLLTRMPASLSISELVKHVKGSSSHLVTHRLPNPEGFKWQGAYGAFSVSKSEVSRVRDYIPNQEQRHREGSIDAGMEPGS